MSEDKKDSIVILDSTGAPALIIPRRHQSAPKEHFAQKALRTSAEEIQSGNYVVTPDPDEHFNYGPTQVLAQHPRVKEALERMERERDEHVNTQEGFERAQQAFEFNERSAQKDKWDGQGRWIGKDNEEMRTVNIMSPFAFIGKLHASGISESRVQLNSYAVNKRAALLAWEYDIAKGKREQIQVATVQYPCGPEWMVMNFDEYGIPTTARFLGWRTALLALISRGVITEKEAHKAFPLGSGPAGDWYREQLQVLRAQQVQTGKFLN